MIVPIAVLAAVFALIAVRRVGSVRFQIWQVMLGGALAVLSAGQISSRDALRSINADVMLFLLGMFVIGAALEESGYLSHLSYKLFRRARNMNELVLAILFGMGIASVFLMNDTLAIIGTPVVMLLARKHGVNPKVLLIALAFAVTTGSAMSPIGNPQNLLIATGGNVMNPFITFSEFLLVPGLINLLLAFLVIRLFYRETFGNGKLNHSQEPIKDRKLAVLSRASLLLLVALISLKILSALLNARPELKLVHIALLSALPILVFGKKRAEIIRRVDWHTLVFFASMFVLMESVWDSGFFQSAIGDTGVDITTIPMILLISVSLSQLISNVPLVALYLPMLSAGGVSTEGMMALAAGSTIAGNLLILGAASNVIIIQNAERRSGETLTFLEFARVGIPLTILNVLVYWLFLAAV